MLLPYPFAGPFDYARAATGWRSQPGDVVLVPLNRRAEIGVVWDAPACPGRGPSSPPVPALKPVDALLDVPRLPPRCAASSTGSPATRCPRPGEVLAMALRVNALQAQPPQPAGGLGRERGRPPG